jgi:hypothetical protein
MTLSFKKAQALKEAGWRQPVYQDLGPGSGEYVVAGNKTAVPWQTSLPIAYSPALEELIDGCPEEIEDGRGGRGWFSLEKKPGRYVASYRHYSELLMGWIFEGATPEEAVADLWLALPSELRVKP